MSICHFSLQHLFVVEDTWVQGDEVTWSTSGFLSGRARICAWICQHLKPHWLPSETVGSEGEGETLRQQDTTKERKGSEGSRETPESVTW